MRSDRVQHVNQENLVSHGSHETRIRPADFGQRSNDTQTGCADHSIGDTHSIAVGHDKTDPHFVSASSDEAGPGANDAQSAIASLIAELREAHRERQDFHNQEKALTLRIKARCRRWVGGDKKEAAVLYKAMMNAGGHDKWLHALSSNQPFLDARNIIEAKRKATEKQMVKMVAELPVYDWMLAINGFGALGLAQIIGEAGNLSDYANPAKLWKRFGLAVMSDGKRQRRVSGDAAIEHGYSPVRRSIVWNIGDALIKKQNAYRELYLERKAWERTEHPDFTDAHTHNRAKRYMEKRLLRDLWEAWRASGSLQSIDAMPSHA